MASAAAVVTVQRQEGSISASASLPRRAPVAQFAATASHSQLVRPRRLSQRSAGRSVRRIAAAAAGNRVDGNEPGDEKVQENLVDMLGLQIDQQHIKTYFEDESDKLRATAEAAKAEFDDMEQLQLDRSSLAFGSAMADINQSADEFEEQLREQRAEMEADEADFLQWQRQMAVDRSRGHFFKGLYTSQADQDAAGTHLRRLPALAERQLAEEPPASRTHLIVCSFLAGVLVMAVAADASSASPSWPQDVLYLCLSGGLAAAAWGQRDTHV